MPSRSKKIATWESKNTALAFRIRKLYELFRAGEMEQIRRSLALSPIPSAKIKDVRLFVVEVSTSALQGLSAVEMEAFLALLVSPKKVVRKKSSIKQAVIKSNFLPSAVVEQRLGMLLLPKLQARHARLFVILAEKDVVSSVWLAFWQQAVPEIVVLADQVQSESRKSAIDLSMVKKVFAQTKPSVLEALSPLTQPPSAVPGYVAVLTALGRSALQIVTTAALIAKSSTTIPIVPVVSEIPMSFSGVLERLYDDGVFLQVRYTIIAASDNYEVIFEPTSLVVGFDPAMYLDAHYFSALSSLEQQKAQSAVETLYVYGRMLEMAERGSDLAQGLTGLLKRHIAEFSLRYGKNMLTMKR